MQTQIDNNMIQNSSLIFGLSVRRFFLILALIIPVLFLGYQALQLSIAGKTGYKVQLRIAGYDPRDLLAGHYLTYRLDLKGDASCKSKGWENSHQAACLCIMDDSKRPQDMEMISCDSSRISNCKAYIRGICSWRFQAGIEKYFIPESEARELDTHVRSQGAWIEVAIGKSGNAQVMDLLLE